MLVSNLTLFNTRSHACENYEVERQRYNMHVCTQKHHIQKCVFVLCMVKYSFLNGKYENFLDEKTAMRYQPVFLSLFLGIQDLAEWSFGNAGLSQSVQEGAVVTSSGPQEKSVVVGQDY